MLRYVLTLIWVGIAGGACASGQICDRAALAAARAHQIPQTVMLAITRLETGRSRGGETRPWPWTANTGGKGHWFETADDLRKFAFHHLKSGRKNIDIGCFQINYRWHGQAFESLSAMIDPTQNANYAARFLRKLYAETGDWTKAVGTYHSRTEAYAARYTRKYQALQARLPDITPAPSAAAKPRVNRLALFTGDGAVQGNGSLVPLTSAAQPLIASE